MTALKGFQRKYLRGLAHDLKPVVLVGEQGISEGVIGATGEALETHELIKVRFRRPTDKKGQAASLAESTRSELCGLIGHTAVLYRKRKEKPSVFVPSRA